MCSQLGKLSYYVLRIETLLEMATLPTPYTFSGCHSCHPTAFILSDERERFQQWLRYVSTGSHPIVGEINVNRKYELLAS